MQDVNEGYSFWGNLKNKYLHGLLLQTFLEYTWDLNIVYMPFYWVLEKNDPRALASLEAEMKDYTFQAFGPEEMQIIGGIKGRSRFKKEKHLCKLLNEGKKCFGIKYKGDIAAFSWVSYDGCTLETYRPAMNDQEVYLFDMFTLPAFRGTKVAPYLRYCIYRTVSAEGRDKFYSVTDKFNKSAIRFKKNINAHNIKKVTYIRFFNYVYCREVDVPLNSSN
ncbi:MAG: hypothetical protein K8I00_09995 [Candidatus Omnitrophica bacterium]|nr:hypothetical protein [Candidatus Omnitrophota bacterium]